MAAKKRSGPIDALGAFLDGLKHTGAGGFEGLVAKLLEAQTGQQFVLSASGAQFGHDSKTTPGASNSIAIECKHYRSLQQPKERDLLGGFDQLATLPDLWVVVASCPLKSQIRDAVREHAGSRGVEVLFLDLPNDGTIGPLSILAAAHFQTVIDWAEFHQQTLDQSTLRTWAEEIEKKAAYSSELDRVDALLKATSLGYDEARRRAKDAVLRALRDEGNSTSSFSQDLAVRASAVNVVTRTEIKRRLSDWWDGSEAGKRAVLLGEEGMGKSWVLMDWIADGLESGRLPLVLPFAAEAGGLPLTVGDLIPKLLHKWTGIREETFWQKRWERWLQSDVRVLIVADGLRDLHGTPWAQFFRTMEDERWRTRVSALCTDRPAHWKGRCQGLRGFAEIEVGGYNEEELQIALSHGGIDIAAIRVGEMRDLVEAPIYCGLACKHFHDLIEAGDFTPERLIWLHMRGCQERKLGTAFSDKQLAGAIANLAQVAKSDIDYGTVSGVANALDSGGRLLQEIIDGGILVPEPGLLPKFTLSNRHLPLGLGLLIADDLRRKTEAELQNEIAGWFEPHNGTDLKVKICRHALFLLFFEYPPSPARKALLEFLFSIHNWAAEPLADLKPYVKRDPGAFIDSAEELFTSRQASASAREFVISAIAQHRDDERVLPLLVAAVPRWLSYCDIGGLVNRCPEHELSVRCKSESERLGTTIQPGINVIFGVQLEVGNDGQRGWLASAAVRVISAGSALPFVDGIAGWALAAGATDHVSCSTAIPWILRLELDDQVHDRLLTVAQQYIDSNTLLGLNAAHYLLDTIDNETSRALVAQHPLQPPYCHYHSGSQFTFPRLGSAEFGHDCQFLFAEENLSTDDVLTQVDWGAFDPSIQVPQSFVTKLENALSAITDPVNDQHAFRKLVPCLGAHAPKAIGDLVRHVAAGLRRGPTATRATAWLFQFYPMLGDSDVKSLVSIIGSSSTDSEAAGRGIVSWRGEIFKVIAPRLSATERYSLWRSLQPAAHLMKACVEPVPDGWRELLEFALSAAQSSTYMRRQALRIVARSSPQLTSHDRERLAKLIEDAQEFAPDVAFLSLEANDEKLWRLCHLDEGDFKDVCSHEDPRSEEARAFIHFSGNLDFATVAKRLHPAVVPFLLQYRGSKPDEMAAYGKQLRNLWEQCLGTTMTITKPSPEDAAEGCATPGWLPIPKQTSDKFVEQETDLFERWLDSPVPKGQEAEAGRLWMPFLYSLLAKRPDLGWSAWGLVCNSYGSRENPLPLHPADVAFVAGNHPTTESKRQRLIDGAVTDEALARIAEAAMQHRAADWLRKQIDDMLASPVPIQVAKGLTLMSYGDATPESMEAAIGSANTAGTWVGGLGRLTFFRRNVKLNSLAQHWYRRFLIAEDADTWCGAWHAMLACVDTRFHHWRSEIESAVAGTAEGLGLKLRYVQLMEGELTERLKASHQERESTLIGIETTPTIKPWIGYDREDDFDDAVAVGTDAPQPLLAGPPRGAE
ncbi:MAG: hypothetical protein U0Q16_23410 [Bryobacteraceae bacterium]